MKYVVLAILVLLIMCCYWLLIMQFYHYIFYFVGAVGFTVVAELHLKGIKHLVHGSRSVLSEFHIFWLIRLAGGCALLLSTQSWAVSIVIAAVISVITQFCDDRRPQL